MKITIDNRDLKNITVDTYKTFTGESYTDESPETEFDIDAVIESFSQKSIEIINKETSTGGIIEGIFFIKSGSPKYYNYTTDWYTADYQVNAENLKKYIESNYSEVEKLAAGYDDSIVKGSVSSESLYHAGLCHYINGAVDANIYMDTMYEFECEAYTENQTVTS
jgi:hypothetical protein